jgi:uncharacterized protein YbcI
MSVESTPRRAEAGVSSAEIPVVGSSRAAAISNMVVRLMSQYTGRGPTKARTYLSDDLVTVVLQDALTKAEHSLVAGDHHQLVLSVRGALHETMRADLAAGIRRILGREVLVMLSANHIEPDFTVETFILAPAAHEPPCPTTSNGASR